ncbi:NAD(P)/FAD-dependent oxidoreductase [Kordiimonas sp.]|uniref:NAD(P)/FAD-dependent oxidoreductase n=1 Tax=Kordiimonas sp. TaxID=1970157 RepID=UPI003A957FE1
MEKHDFIIIGGGIIGITTALELQAAGHGVLVLDRGGVGSGCSYGNAGHIAAEHIFPLATPALLRALPGLLLQPNGPVSLKWRYLIKLMPWLVRFLLAARPSQVARSTEAIASLNAGAIAAYESLDARFGLDGLLKQDGTLVAYMSAKGLEGAAREKEALAHFSIKSELMDQKALGQFDPALNPTLMGGLYFRHSAHIEDPYALTQTLKAHFLALGGKVEEAEITHIEHRAKCTTVYSTDKVWRADKVVIAAGAHSHLLARQLGYKIPLETERGYHLDIPRPSVSPRVPTTFFEKRFVATPMRHTQMAVLRLAGRVEFGGLNAKMTLKQALALLPLGQNLLPDLGGDDRHTRATETVTLSPQRATPEGIRPWMGFRPTLPDSLPVMGKAPKHAGVYFCFGHQHLGLTQAAISARVMLGITTSFDAGIDVNPFRVDRF